MCVEESEPDKVSELFETNFFAPAELIKMVLPIMRAQKSGLPRLHLSLGLRPDGGLRRLTLPGPDGAGCYLGVCDLGMERFSASACAQLIEEAQRLGAAGLAADCERDSAPVREFLAALDSQCAARGLPLFVPLARADCVQNAIVIADTAISGGSLRDRFGALLRRYPGRVAADLRPVSRDFLLPAADPEGVPLSADERDALCARTGAQTFFSRELCARYFTYMDSAANGHFVLFDDADTLREKCRCLEAVGVRQVFARYPDVRPLLPVSP